MLLNNQKGLEPTQEKKKTPRNNDNKSMMIKPMECWNSSSKREVYNNEILPPKKKKNIPSNKQLSITPKAAKKNKHNLNLAEGKIL